MINIDSIELQRVTLHLHLDHAIGRLPGNSQKFHDLVGVDLDVIRNESVFAVDGNIYALGFDDARGRHAAGDDDIVIAVEGSRLRSGSTGDLIDRCCYIAGNQAEIDEREYGESVCLKAYRRSFCRSGKLFCFVSLEVYDLNIVDVSRVHKFHFDLDRGTVNGLVLHTVLYKGDIEKFSVRNTVDALAEGLCRTGQIVDILAVADLGNSQLRIRRNTAGLIKCRCDLIRISVTRSNSCGNDRADDAVYGEAFRVETDDSCIAFTGCSIFNDFRCSVSGCLREMDNVQVFCRSILEEDLHVDFRSVLRLYFDTVFYDGDIEEMRVSDLVAFERGLSISQVSIVLRACQNLFDIKFCVGRNTGIGCACRAECVFVSETVGHCPLETRNRARILRRNVGYGVIAEEGKRRQMQHSGRKNRQKHRSGEYR